MWISVILINVLTKLLNVIIRFAYVCKCPIEQIYGWCWRALRAVTAVL